MPCPLPHVITSTSCESACAWIAENRSLIEELLNTQGGALLRGFRVIEKQDFQEAFSAYCNDALRYVYRSTPRTDLGGGVYTATEYPQGLPIPLHNENSYQREWPLLIMFCCLRPADNKTGQTPLADIVRVTDRIDAEIRRLFLKKKVKYIRNYRPHIDLPWQKVFQTESTADVNLYCIEHDIEAHWSSDGSLRTEQVCEALAVHPVSGLTVWFNQAHLFHPSSLDQRTRKLMLKMFPEDGFPRNVTFGDGTPIEESMLTEVRKAFEHETVTFEWNQGDILILDNMRVAHGRTPFSGQRRVLTAMGRPYSPPATIHDVPG